MKENICKLELGLREEVKWYISDLINSELYSNETNEKLKELTDSDINDIANDMLYDDNLCTYIENIMNYKLSMMIGVDL